MAQGSEVGEGHHGAKQPRKILLASLQEDIDVQLLVINSLSFVCVCKQHTEMSDTCKELV